MDPTPIMPVPRISIRGASPPITILTDDILFYIFSINADMTNDGFWDPNHNELRRRALHVTRHTSQVSRHWRTLILERPTIWAGLIDLQLFQPGLENWREEVFRRCCKCLLSVKGCYNLERDPAIPSEDKDILIDFFDTYWDRIKDLHIRVMAANLVDDEIWVRILCRPSRLLRTFNLKFEHNDYWDGPNHQLFPSSRNPDATLFSNIAPALQRFHQDLTITLPALRAPWLSQLRTLELDFSLHEGPHITVTQVLDLLEDLLILEVLNIYARYWSLPSTTDKRLRPVELPRLLCLGLKCTTTTVEECIYFFGHFTPGKGCSLSFDANGSRLFGYNKEECVDQIATLAKHFAVYAKGLNWHYAESLALTISTTSFEFTAHDISWRNNSDFFESSPANFNLELKLNIVWSRLDSSNFLPILCCMPFSSFGSLKVFDLHFPRGDCYFALSPREEFLDFLKSLHSVETLIASNTTLLRLVQCYRNFPGLFPSLRTLEMQSLAFEHVAIDSEVPIDTNIMDFLRWRTEDNREIEILDLSSSDAYEYDLRFLDAMTGLKVMLGDKNHEYVCGTGTPERLDLKQLGGLELVEEYDPNFLEFEDEQLHQSENELPEDDSEWP